MKMRWAAILPYLLTSAATFWAEFVATLPPPSSSAAALGRLGLSPVTDGHGGYIGTLLVEKWIE